MPTLARLMQLDVPTETPKDEAWRLLLAASSVRRQAETAVRYAEGHVAFYRHRLDQARAAGQTNRARRMFDALDGAEDDLLVERAKLRAAVVDEAEAQAEWDRAKARTAVG